MLAYIHGHYMMHISTKDLAEQVNVSESECLRCFKEVLETTPMQYVKKYRLHVAAELLASTGLTVTGVAGRCGFEHMSYFAKSFEQMFGTTPREYRKRVENTTAM